MFCFNQYSTVLCATCVYSLLIFFQKGITPLMWAADRGHPEVARLLLDGGARINTKHRVVKT